jgi:pimeloyl-ACP methyl ester carboxylesterase
MRERGSRSCAKPGVPTTPIWGPHDRANRLRITQDASAHYGWPLHVIENCADDPPRERPLAFLEALRMALGTERRQQVTA